MYLYFLPHRTVISTHWWGFHDPQSQLLHYEWRVGTTPGGADVHAPKRVHLAQSTLVSVAIPLPLNTTVYVTVRAVNHAGLWSESTSNGFIVDDTPPEVVELPKLDNSRGVLRNDTQVLSNFWSVWHEKKSISFCNVQLCSGGIRTTWRNSVW